jgi:hypothetical protein
MEKLKEILIHFIAGKNGELIATRQAINVPRVGDQVRLPGNKFYKVDMVVWVYDEPESLYHRVNIGLKKIK